MDNKKSIGRVFIVLGTFILLIRILDFVMIGQIILHNVIFLALGALCLALGIYFFKSKDD